MMWDEPFSFLLMKIHRLECPYLPLRTFELSQDSCRSSNASCKDLPSDGLNQFPRGLQPEQPLDLAYSPAVSSTPPPKYIRDV